MTPPTPEGRARVWVSTGADFVYPEQDPALGGPRPSTAICLSGGSTRAFAAAVGQLRGLTALGLIPRVGYLSSVSGGAWAATPYTYYATPATEPEILGAVVPPEKVTAGTLGEIAPRSLGAAATLDFRATLEKLAADTAVPRDEIWFRAVGQTFLSPYGVFDADHPSSFTFSRETRRQILDRNPWLADRQLDVVRTGAPRPHLLIHAALSRPARSAGNWESINYEYSPLYIGTPRLHELRSADGATRLLGGGYLEPFAFGCPAPRAVPDAHGLVAVRVPRRLFTLAHVIGATSAFSTPDRDFGMYPHADCWPITGRAGEETAAEVFTDGGDLENYGLIPLLCRRVERIVVFINSVWPLSLDYDPTGWPNERQDARWRELDPFLAPLFGQPSARFPHNQVFPESDYPTVIRALQTAKREGRTALTTTTHAVQSNEWWGVDGGWTVRVCWVYNERVREWEERLGVDLRRSIEEGRAPIPSGPFAHFPHYLTRGQNPGCLIRLTPAQVNLLAHLSCWNVMSQAEVFRELLES